MQRIHGLNVRCALRLPGLTTGSAETPDVEITISPSVAAPALPTTSLYRSAAGSAGDPWVHIVRDDRGTVCFRYSDGSSANVEWQESPVRIDASIGPGQTLDDLCAYLYGPVLGFVLRARGVLALHASCVEVDGGAVLFAGESGTGKSTTAAFFAQHGHVVLSDDLTALRQEPAGFSASPAFDHVRLWRASEEILFGHPDTLAPITPTWGKLRFPLTGRSFASTAHPVRAIFILDDPGATSQYPAIRAMPPRTALLALATLTYANYLLDGPARAMELGQLGALVAAVPVHWLAAHLEGAHLSTLRDRVLTHLADSPVTVPR